MNRKKTVLIMSGQSDGTCFNTHQILFHAVRIDHTHILSILYILNNGNDIPYSLIHVMRRTSSLQRRYVISCYTLSDGPNGFKIYKKIKLISNKCKKLKWCFCIDISIIFNQQQALKSSYLSQLLSTEYLFVKELIYIYYIYKKQYNRCIRMLSALQQRDILWIAAELSI